ncbi:MAG: tetratricopeptide repeat protein [Thermoguttaceae bacterium]|jgi:tetratricopeptide (TPR) repeat protein
MKNFVYPTSAGRFVARVVVTAFLVAVVAIAPARTARAAAGDDLLATGQSHYQNGDFNAAVSTLEAFISQYPTSTSRNKGELYLGCSYLARNASANDIASARSHFDYILAQGKSAGYYRDAFFHNARSYYNSRDYENAKTQLLEFLNEFPSDDFLQYVYYYLGVCETNVGTLDQAISWYDRSEAEFPNSPLRWFCKLEKATLHGRMGQYSESERQLAAIASDSTAPSNVVGQATIQRALIMLVQRDAQGAIRLLDSYIQRYRNDPNSVTTVQDAYLYEAYAYFAMKEYQRALNLIDEVERIGSTLPPAAASVKLKLFLALGRTADAESLLNRLANSPYGLDKPDVITAHRAMIDAVLGNRDRVISSLNAMLSPRSTSPTSNVVEFNYFNTSRNHLDPLDFVEACGSLTVAYAGQYGATKNPSDNAAQEALYQATARYVATLRDPAIELILGAIDRARKAAITNPNNPHEGFDAITPGLNPGAPVGGDGFTNPGLNNQNNGISTPPNNQNSGGNQNSGSNQNQNTYAPGSNTNTNQRPPFPPANNSNNQSGSTNSSGYPNDPNANVGQGDQLPAANRLTPEQARLALEQATNYYANLEFDRANEVLLEAMMQSETFWTDSPAEAARIALLRANALLELGKRSEAQMTCQDLVAQAPNTQEASVAYYYLGALADSVGRRDEAIDNLRRATSGGRDFPYADAALYYLGINEQERGDVNSAVQSFNRIYRNYPSSPYWSHAVWSLARIEADRRNDVPAEKLVNEALGNRPDSAIVDYLLFLKGEIALRAKDYDKAMIAFDMIVDQYPDSVWFSQAKNRLTTIPERFLNTAAGLAPVEEPIVAEPPPRPRVDAPLQNNLGVNDAYISSDRRGLDQNSPTSVRIPTSEELRLRALQGIASNANRGSSSSTNSSQTQQNPPSSSGSSSRNSTSRYGNSSGL